MADSGDTTGLLAPQELVTISLGPAVIGWMVQLILCGASTTLVWIYCRDTTLRRSPMRSFNNVMLVLATAANLVTTGMNCDEIYHYLISQNRSTESISSYIPSDIWITLPQGCVAVLSQVYFATRCYKLIGRNKIFAALIVLPIAASFAGALGSAVVLYLGLPSKSVLAVAELWLWASAGTDIIIAICLAVSMSRTKQGFNLSTDNVIDSVIRLAIATAALPALIAVIAALIFVFTYKSDTLFNTFAVFVSILPSVYIFSFVQCLCFRADGSSGSTMSLSRRPVTPQPIVFSVESANFSHKIPMDYGVSPSEATLVKSDENRADV